MTETGDIDLDDVDPATLIDQNGLAQLFANRVRAKVIVALFYADEPLTIPEIADAVGMSQTVTHQAHEQLQKFGIIEQTTGEEDTLAYTLPEDDELVEQLRVVAELATERLYD